MITIGIDPHKSSLTAGALTPAGVPVGQLRLAVTKNVGEELLAWAQTWPQRQWAVEGASGLGRAVAQRLAATGATVLDVPAKLAARARLLGSGSARKTEDPRQSPPKPETAAVERYLQASPRGPPAGQLNRPGNSGDSLA